MSSQDNPALGSRGGVRITDPVLMPSLLAAIHAVLELHQPVKGFKSPVCSVCHPALYPCPTVAAIHSALGEETT